MEIADITNLNNLCIILSAYEKIKCVFQTAFELIEDAVGFYWLLLVTNKRIVCDIIVPEQSITAAFVRVDMKKILQLLSEIQQIHGIFDP